jgi:predicted metal-dependent phosphoesterase TrpH
MKIEMHVHSKYSNDCNLEIKDIIKQIKKKNLDGFALTDHNSIKGWKQARKLAKLNNLKFIPACEIKTNKGEVIGYFMKRKIKSTKFENVLNELKKQNAKISIPHAFDTVRRSSAVCDKYIIIKNKNKIDYLELNRRSLFSNKKVLSFAKKYNFKLIAGSDAHWLWEIGKYYTNLNTNKIYRSDSLNFMNLILTRVYKWKSQ